jgi:hypothetical protein
MGAMISDEMKSRWTDILKRYNDMVTEKNVDVGENEIDIQAKRLVNAEAAALTYLE